MKQHDLALARHFFEGNSRGPAPSPGLSISHYLPPVQLGETIGRGDHNFSEAWAMEQQQHLQAFEISKAKAAWASEFGSASQLPIGPSIQQNMAPQQDSEL